MTIPSLTAHREGIQFCVKSMAPGTSMKTNIFVRLPPPALFPSLFHSVCLSLPLSLSLFSSHLSVAYLCFFSCLSLSLCHSFPLYLFLSLHLISRSLISVFFFSCLSLSLCHSLPLYLFLSLYLISRSLISVFFLFPTLLISISSLPLPIYVSLSLFLPSLSLPLTHPSNSDLPPPPLSLLPSRLPISISLSNVFLQLFLFALLCSSLADDRRGVDSPSSPTSQMDGFDFNPGIDDGFVSWSSVWSNVKIVREEGMTSRGGIDR